MAVKYNYWYVVVVDVIVVDRVFVISVIVGVIV